MDMDAECWKNIEPMLNGYGFVGCFNYRGDQGVGNGFLAAIPHHPLLENIIKSLPHTASSDVFSTAGPSFLGSHVQAFDNHSKDVKIYPPHFTYPQDALGRWRVDRNHPEIFIWNYMDAWWWKPEPRSRIIRGVRRVIGMVLSKMSLIYNILRGIKLPS
jgi:mannosyltransferase OCH1-like enzyme